MTEEKFGYEMADKIIVEAKLPNDGAYTSVGTYPHSELVKLLTLLNQHSEIDSGILLREFGEYVFKVFLKRYKSMFEGIDNGFSFLSIIEDTIHKEVLKLYPEAELPSIDTDQSEQQLKLVYRSSRKMSDFAEGLINGCMEYYGENVSIEKQLIKADGSEVQFIIIPQ